MASSLNIVFLISQDLESPSGLGRYGPLARELVKLGHSAKIIGLHPNFKDLKTSNFVEDGVHVQYVAPMHVIKSGDKKGYYSSSQLINIAIKAAWEMSRAAHSTDADILHIGKPHPMNSLAGLYARSLDKNLLFIDCDDFEAASGRFQSGWQRSVVSFFERKIPKIADAVTTNTDFMRKKLVTWGVENDRISYLPNGVDIDRTTKPDPEAVRLLKDEYDLKNRLVIAFIGSISLPSHPINLLVEAFKQVHNLEPDTRLLIVGGGEDIESLKDLSQEMGIAKEVIFSGKVPREKISLFYSLADVTVDPVYDNDAARGRQPLKIFESWYYGVPLVSAAVGDREQLLGEPPAGILTEAGDSGALAMAIHGILTNPNLAQQLADLGSERVKQYTWELIAKQLNERYLEYASRHS
ncbi:MAG: glycosyltransferase family 4 protein [Chloroflexota bacterium]|nr:MAG: glycosyltransferase family 4 protein [Chloroflexota bacterium]